MGTPTLNSRKIKFVKVVASLPNESEMIQSSTRYHCDFTKFLHTMRAFPLYQFPLLCLCLAGASLAPVAAMSLDEAETALCNDSFKVRQEAEEVIRKLGMDAFDRVERLTLSDEPEIAFRARTCLPIILMDVDDQFPPDLADKLRHIDNFSGQKLNRIVDDLKALDPARPVTLIGLINHWKFKHPASGDRRERFESPLTKMERALQIALSGDGALSMLGRIHPERYQPETLALVLNTLCKVRPHDITPILALHESWIPSQPEISRLLNADGYRLEVARIVNKAPNRVEALGQLFNFPANHDLAPAQLTAVQKAVEAELRRDDILADLGQIPADRYEGATLAMILNGLCRQRPDDLAAILVLYNNWSHSHPQLAESLNADGYRLELARETDQAPNRIEAMRALLARGAKNSSSPLQLAALRKQLGSYQEDAGTFPVESLDQATGWFFFNTVGATQLDAYRKFRERFPDINESSLLSQPLEVMLLLEKSGPSVAFTYALKQNTHGGMTALAEWLHNHPELIREPLPLPQKKIGDPYSYRVVKFFRIFAPYATETEMQKNPEINSAFKILAKDADWKEVAKQARVAISEQHPNP